MGDEESDNAKSHTFSVDSQWADWQFSRLSHFDSFLSVCLISKSHLAFDGTSMVVAKYGTAEEVALAKPNRQSR